MSAVEATYLSSHVPETLERVRAGEQVLVTESGVVIAQIVPPNSALTPDQANRRGVVAADIARIKSLQAEIGALTREEVIERLRTFSRGIRLDGLSIADMRREGRQE